MAASKNKITEDLLAGKGIKDLPRFPNLKDGKMQAKFDELVREVVVPAHNELIETLDSEFATRDYVHSQMRDSDNGNMVTGVYDTDEDGAVQVAANGLMRCTHERDGERGVHVLTCGFSACSAVRFTAAADYVAGDSFELFLLERNGNGDPQEVKVELSTVDASGAATQLPDGIFKAGSEVVGLVSGENLCLQVGMPMTGGTFLGNVAASTQQRTGDSLMNICVRNPEDTQDVASSRIVMVRKGE